MKGKIIIKSISGKLGGGFTAYHESAEFINGDGKNPIEALKDFITHYGDRHLSSERAVEAEADCICPKFSDGTKMFPQRTCDACKGSA